MWHIARVRPDLVGLFKSAVCLGTWKVWKRWLLDVVSALVPEENAQPGNEGLIRLNDDELVQQVRSTRRQQNHIRACNHALIPRDAATLAPG